MIANNIQLTMDEVVQLTRLSYQIKIGEQANVFYKTLVTSITRRSGVEGTGYHFSIDRGELVPVEIAGHTHSASVPINMTCGADKNHSH